MAKTFTGRQIMDAIGIENDSYGADLTTDTEARTESLLLEDVAANLRALSRAAKVEAEALLLDEKGVMHLIESVRNCMEQTHNLGLPEPVGPAVKRGMDTVLGKLEALLPQAEEA